MEANSGVFSLLSTKTKVLLGLGAAALAVELFAFKELDFAMGVLAFGAMTSCCGAALSCLYHDVKAFFVIQGQGRDCL